MLNHVFPVLRLVKKSSTLFLVQTFRFTHREITQKNVMCDNCISNNTKLDAIYHVNKPRTRVKSSSGIRTRDIKSTSFCGERSNYWTIFTSSVRRWCTTCLLWAVQTLNDFVIDGFVQRAQFW